MINCHPTPPHTKHPLLSTPVQEPPHALRYKTAADVMASPPVGLNAVASVPRVLELLRRTTHSAFVVYDDSSGRDPALGRGRLAGLVLRSQLMVLLRYGVFSDARGRYLDPPQDAAALERWLVAEMAARQVPHRSSNKLVQAGRADAAHIVPRLVLREMRDHPLVRAAAEEAGIKVGPYITPFRVAITGRTVAPPLFESMEVLGKDETLRRVDNATRAFAAFAATTA